MPDGKKLTPEEIQALLDEYKRILAEERAKPGRTEKRAQDAADSRFKKENGTTIEAIQEMVVKEETATEKKLRIERENILADLRAGNITNVEARDRLQRHYAAQEYEGYALAQKVEDDLDLVLVTEPRIQAKAEAKVAAEAAEESLPQRIAEVQDFYQTSKEAGGVVDPYAYREAVERLRAILEGADPDSAFVKELAGGVAGGDTKYAATLRRNLDELARALLPRPQPEKGLGLEFGKVPFTEGYSPSTRLSARDLLRSLEKGSLSLQQAMVALGDLFNEGLISEGERMRYLEVFYQVARPELAEASYQPSPEYLGVTESPPAPPLPRPPGALLPPPTPPEGYQWIAVNEDYARLYDIRAKPEDVVRMGAIPETVEGFPNQWRLTPEPPPVLSGPAGPVFVAPPFSDEELAEKRRSYEMATAEAPKEERLTFEEWMNQPFNLPEYSASGVPNPRLPATQPQLAAQPFAAPGTRGDFGLSPSALSRSAFLSAVPQGMTRAKTQTFQGMFNQALDDLLTDVGRQIRGGQEPTLNAADYFANYPFEQKYGELTPREKGVNMGQFAPFGNWRI